MEVDPSDQDLIDWELVEILKLFTFFGKSHNLWAVLEGNLERQKSSESLPKATKDHMWLLLDEIVRINTNHFNTKTLCSSDTHLKIFYNFVDIHIFLSVDSSGIKALVINSHHELTEHNTIIKNMEKRVIIDFHWKQFLAVLIILKVFVYHLGES